MVSVAAPAHSELITTTGPSAFTLNFNCTVGGAVGCSDATSGGVTAALSATAAFSGLNIAYDPIANVTTLSTTLQLTNTTAQGSLSASNWDSIRLVDFGFDTAPDEKSASDTSTVFNTYLDQTLPSFTKVDICLSSGATCAGGGSGGLSPVGATNVNAPNHTDTFSETMTFAGNVPQIDLGTNVAGGPEIFGIKFQTDFGSFEFTCQVGTTCGGGGGGGGGQVPEPGTLLLLGSGLLALGLTRYRRRARQNLP